MPSIRTCELFRGAAEDILLKEIQKLRKACEVEAPNKRLVANLVASLDIAQDNLIKSHVALVIDMNAQLDEDRFTQYINGWVDATEEVKAIAEVITEAVEQCKDEVTTQYANQECGTNNFEEKFMQAEREKLSEEVHKQYKDEVTNHCT